MPKKKNRVKCDNDYIKDHPFGKLTTTPNNKNKLMEAATKTLNKSPVKILPYTITHCSMKENQNLRVQRNSADTLNVLQNTIANNFANQKLDDEDTHGLSRLVLNKINQPKRNELQTRYLSSRFGTARKSEIDSSGQQDSASAATEMCHSSDSKVNTKVSNKRLLSEVIDVDVEPTPRKKQKMCINFEYSIIDLDTDLDLSNIGESGNCQTNQIDKNVKCVMEDILLNNNLIEINSSHENFEIPDVNFKDTKEDHNKEIDEDSISEVPAEILNLELSSEDSDIVFVNEVPTPNIDNSVIIVDDEAPNQKQTCKRKKIKKNWQRQQSQIKSMKNFINKTEGKLRKQIMNSIKALKQDTPITTFTNAPQRETFTNTQQIRNAQQLEIYKNVPKSVPPDILNQSLLSVQNQLESISKVVINPSLREIVIDGSNVAFGHSNNKFFSVRGLVIAIEYFLKRSHKVTAFVPLFRQKSNECSSPSLLKDLADRRLVIFTPSREFEGRRITPYDDRFIIQYAHAQNGVIVSNDNYRDILVENPEFRATIQNNILMYTWVDNMILFPEDPLGRFGPRLNEFLKKRV